jgi:uncharacterized membrane protein
MGTRRVRARGNLDASVPGRGVGAVELLRQAGAVVLLVLLVLLVVAGLVVAVRAADPSRSIAAAAHTPGRRGPAPSPWWSSTRPGGERLRTRSRHPVRQVLERHPGAPRVHRGAQHLWQVRGRQRV